jgi:lipoprotein signal peptidase
MLSVVGRRRFLLVAAAMSCAVIDLAHKTLNPADFHHARTLVAGFFMAALVAGLVVLVPRIASNAAALGAGIACGGALGNLVSLLAWEQGVPDPIIVAGVSQGIAFNLADVFALGGNAVLLSAAFAYGVRHRERLREPV